MSPKTIFIHTERNMLCVVWCFTRAEHTLHWFYFHFGIIIETAVNNSNKQSSNDQWFWLLSVMRDLQKKNLLSSSHLPPYSHCVLVRFKARLLCIYVKLKAHINIIWNSQHHIKIYETTKCIPIFMLIVYIFIVTHLSVRSNWTQYLFVHCYARNCIRFIFFILEFVTVKMSVQKKKEERHCICTTGMIDVYQ